MSRQASADEDRASGPSCREVLQQLERYLDGELPDGRISQLRQHLSDCYPCANRASFEEQVRALVRECCAEQAPRHLLERIRERLDRVSSAEDPPRG